MKQVRNSIRIVLFTLIIFSCSKKDEEPNLDGEVNEILTSVSLQSSCPNETTQPKPWVFS